MIVLMLALTLAAAAPQDVVEVARARVDTLGTYRLRFTKEELVKGKWLGPQVMDLVVREQPYAVKGEVVSGPNKGRRFEYDATKDPTKIRVREGGLLGIVPISLDINHPLTRSDTRHAVNELGYGFVLKMIGRDEQLTRERGGFARVDEGDGCVMLTAPAGVSGLYGQRVRLCFDQAARLLTRVEIWDERGRALEKLRFELVEERLASAE